MSNSPMTNEQVEIALKNYQSNDLACPFCSKPVDMWNTGYGVVRVLECKKCKVRFVMPWNATNEKIRKMFEPKERR